MKRVEGKMAELLVCFFGLVLIIFYGVYYIHVYLHKNTKWKYIFSLCLFIFGLLGWLIVWLGLGWLKKGIVSTGLLMLSLCSFSLALCIDWITKNKEYVFGRRKVNGTY
jgi:heme A synthase